MVIFIEHMMNDWFRGSNFLDNMWTSYNKVQVVQSIQVVIGHGVDVYLTNLLSKGMPEFCTSPWGWTPISWWLTISGLGWSSKWKKIKGPGASIYGRYSYLPWSFWVVRPSISSTQMWYSFQHLQSSTKTVRARTVPRVLHLRSMSSRHLCSCGAAEVAKLQFL